MAFCEAPSFSLGFDSDLPSPRSPINPPPFAAPNPHDGQDFSQQQVSDSDPDTGPDPPRRILKRLRRGPPPPDPQPQQPPLDADEDIEEFSSQDDDDLLQVHSRSSAWNHSVCSSSKVSLNGSGVLTPHSSRVRTQKEACSDAPAASTKMETGKAGLVFPKLTTSPLRRFQLLSSDSDSDSDDPLGEDVITDHKIASNGPPLQHSVTKTKFSVNRDRDHWKDFSPVKSFSIPTPAFNEVCDEYFRSAKNKEAEKPGSHGKRCVGVNSSFQEEQQLWESASPVPPAHRYFFHEDSRIQQMVRSRLCNFSPLGVNRVNRQPNTSHIDYMEQFGNGASGQKGSAKSSTRGNNKSRNLIVEENFDASGGWVDPRNVSSFANGESSRMKATKRNSSKNSVSRGKNKANKLSSSNVLYTSANWVEPKRCSSMPMDAGKRRVQASGQSAGHWFTSSDGRKVYVNKSGQEMTGRIAYRQYRKESGTGFKKSRKKTSAKKTNAKKKN